MSLFRGMADDLPLMTWLTEHIWPAESRWVDSVFTADGLRLAAAEMIRSGTTCFSDMFYFPDAAAHCSQEIGMRSVIGLIVLDFPSAWAQRIRTRSRRRPCWPGPIPTRIGMVMPRICS